MVTARLPRAALLCALLAGAQACATARNYDDPSGPVFIGQGPVAVRTTRALRLVTFNLKFGEQVERAAELLTQPGPLFDPDVLVLQEMDGPGTERLARSLGMSYVYVPSAVHPSSRRDIGVAVLSRWPIDGASKLLLPREHRLRKMRRAAATATVQTSGVALRVYAVHLETAFGASDDDRRAQARAVLQDAAGWPGATLIAGDFNGTDGPDEIAKAGFLWLTRDVHDTSWVFDFDHILVRGLCATADPPAARGPDARGVSDHRPVWAVVQPCEASTMEPQP